jgi:hypothetical protein
MYCGHEHIRMEENGSGHYCVACGAKIKIEVID